MHLLHMDFEYVFRYKTFHSSLLCHLPWEPLNIEEENLELFIDEDYVYHQFIIFFRGNNEKAIKKIQKKEYQEKGYV